MVEKGLVYVEYISRRAEVGLREFHEDAIRAQERWATTGQGQDQSLLSAARTWRLGPEPEYIHVWYSPGRELERLDDWEGIFRAGEAERHEATVGRVSRIDRAGCYRALRPPVAARNGTYYAELFRATGDLNDVRAHFDARVSRHPTILLNLLAVRIGRLAPDPGGLAVWTLPSFAALAELAEELDGVREPLVLEDAATYADTGREIH
ncbi:MAG: hypothetical protein ACRDJN_29800 [Chloroflexota bacterium]